MGSKYFQLNNMNDYIGGYIGEADKDYGELWGQSGNLIHDMWGRITDPNKRGYDPKTVNSMVGRQTDMLAGNKTSYMRNLGKLSSGMGYGGAIGGMKGYQKQHESEMRGAARDVDIANQEAKRGDLWNAVAGYGTGMDAFSRAAAGKVGARTQGVSHMLGYNQAPSQDKSIWSQIGNFALGAGTALL